MEKVTSLISAKSSSPFARQRPRSLKYYLSAGLHHKVVGKFAAGIFFSSESSVHDNIQASNMNPRKINAPKADNEKKPNSVAAGLNKSDSGPIANYTQAAKDPDLTREMVKLSNEVLATAKTVFPIDPFPDTVVLDRTTLNITKRTFFFSNDTLSIRIEDILNAHVNVGPFLGSLTIASRILSSEDHFTITNLWRKDAIHLKHMIQGYIIALHNEIEISHLNRQELIDTISELGHDLNS